MEKQEERQVEEKQEAILTRHSKKRGKKRLGVGKDTTKKIADKALECGITHAETKGRLKKFVDALYLSHGNANNIRIYHQKVYLFRADVLITIINLPARFVEVAAKIQKAKNRQMENNNEK